MAFVVPIAAIAGGVAMYKLFKKGSRKIEHDLDTLCVPGRYIASAKSAFPEEYDQEDRETQVILLMSPLNEVSLLENFTSLHHWAIGCVYGNRAVIYELTGNECIAPSWSNWNWDEFDETFSHYIHLGTTVTNPAKMRRLAFDNIYNGTKYRVIGNNCQDWVEWLLHELEPQLARNMFDRGIRKFNQTFVGHNVNKSSRRFSPTSIMSSSSSQRRERKSCNNILELDYQN